MTTNARHSKLYDHTPDASLPERITRSTHDIMMQMKLHQPNMPKLRPAPVAPSIHMGYLTDPLKFDLLETFFSTQRGHDIAIQWMLLDLQGWLPPSGHDLYLKNRLYNKVHS